MTHFFAEAVRRELLAANPFGTVVSGSVGNEQRQYFVTRKETLRQLEACPDSELRLIVALSRFGGLRCPSEHIELRWQDINWNSGIIIVRSPKTEKQGKPFRRIPLFPELREFLTDSWDLALPGAEFVLTRCRDPNGAHINKRLGQLIQQAGMIPWPRITHNLRASRQTELERTNPTHVVCAIMGNTPRVAQRHYLQVTDEDLTRARSSQVVHQAVQYGAESGCIGSQTTPGEQRGNLTQLAATQNVACQSEPARFSSKESKAGVDGNRTHLASFQRPHRV